MKMQNEDLKSTNEEEKGIIGEYFENGFPVIMKFVNQIPGKEILNKYPFLIIISWKYNGEKNNGMPEKKINERMIIPCWCEFVTRTNYN